MDKIVFLGLKKKKKTEERLNKVIGNQENVVLWKLKEKFYEGPSCQK